MENIKSLLDNLFTSEYPFKVSQDSEVKEIMFKELDNYLNILNANRLSHISQEIISTVEFITEMLKRIFINFYKGNYLEAYKDVSELVEGKMTSGKLNIVNLTNFMHTFLIQKKIVICFVPDRLNLVIL